MPWDERYQLGVADMDATHQQFVTAVDALLAASDEMFPALFAQIIEHTRWHFEHEDKLMQACGFPAIAEHSGEHRRVLGELAHFARSISVGRLVAARAYVKALPEWFSSHLATMDSALAACIKVRQRAVAQQVK